MKKIFLVICIVVVIFLSCFTKSKKEEHSAVLQSSNIDVINEKKT